MAEQSILTGVHEKFYWLASHHHYMGSLFKVCPEIVVGKYVAITSNDSGLAKLDAEHFTSGWQLRKGVGYSPRISFVDYIPHQLDGPNVPGFDEIYVFDSPPEDLGEAEHSVVSGRLTLGKIGVFVNTLGFAVHESRKNGSEMERLFWSQLKQLSPFAYLSDGMNWVTFVTRDRNLLVKVRDCFTSEIDVINAQTSDL